MHSDGDLVDIILLYMRVTHIGTAEFWHNFLKRLPTIIFRKLTKITKQSNMSKIPTETPQ
jgi:hypothetical protein